MVVAKNGKRFLAFLVDIVIVEFIITKPLNKILQNYLSEELNFLSLGSISPNFIFISLSVGLLSVLYWAILEYKVGQTLGALLFKLQARGEKKGMTFGMAFLRNLSKLSIILLIIDSLNIFFNNKRKRFLEVFSKTETVSGEGK